MEHHDNEDRSPGYRYQQHQQLWAAQLGPQENPGVEPVTGIPSALAQMGLGEARTYLTSHPEYVTEALQHRVWSVRAAALQTLGRQEARASLAQLQLALHDENMAVRATAVRMLGMQGERAPVEPLMEALRDPEWRVRTAAILALGRLTGRTPTAPLVEALEDEHASVRAAAVWALGTLGKQAPVERLVRALQDRAWSVREAAVMALQEQEEQIPVAPLLSARWDDDSNVRQAADYVLEYRFGEQEYAEQKIQPGRKARKGLSSSWPRLGLTIFSLLSLLPASSMLANNMWSGRMMALIGTVGMLMIGAGIVSINWLYQRKFQAAANETQEPSKGRAISWGGVIVGALSVAILPLLYSQLLSDFNPGFYPAEAINLVYFTAVARFIMFIITALTVVGINIAFHAKQNGEE
jgi:hypothetical protein